MYDRRTWNELHLLQQIDWTMCGNTLGLGQLSSGERLERSVDCLGNEFGYYTVDHTKPRLVSDAMAWGDHRLTA